MTAFRRPNYLRKALESWEQVRGIGQVPFTIFLEPSDRHDKMMEVISACRSRGVLDLRVQVNAEVLGVDVNIVKGAQRLWADDPELEFLIFAEEDLLVSTDTLEYFKWSAEKFRERSDVLIVCGHTDDNPSEDADPSEVTLGQRFRCWSWGLWRNRWEQTVFPTWDYDASSGEFPGDPADWAWGLDLRIIPRGGFRTVLPAASRSQNIGKWEGVHAHPGLFDKTVNPSFRLERDPVAYQLIREEEILPPGTRKYHRD